MVHKDWAQNANGYVLVIFDNMAVLYIYFYRTLISKAGSIVHTGQLFFDESWNNQVFATSPYTSNKNSRTLNANDRVLAVESANGNNAFIQ